MDIKDIKAIEAIEKILHNVIQDNGQVWDSEFQKSEGVYEYAKHIYYGIKNGIGNGTQKRAVCALILRGNKVLAVSRKDNHNVWGFIGGKVDEGEDIISALLRETEEETGLKITEYNLIFNAIDYGGYDTYLYLCEAEGEINTAEKGLVKEVEWDELFTGNFKQYNREAYRRYCQYELLKEYPVQDDIWPSRRWNADHTDYVDLSGESDEGAICY